MNSIKIDAPAKINIGLRVLEKRKDGFHNIQTLFYPILGLHDEITITKSDENKIAGNFPNDVNDKNNLIIKAKKFLEQEINNELKCQIEMNKIIPIGAGLGGGSSDAAATLKALNKLFELNISKSKLHNIALSLGSDVPFFINSQPAIGTSRGEILNVVPITIPYHILLINPHIHISTKEAFENIIPKYEMNNYLKLDFNDGNNLPIYQNEIKNDFEDFVFNKYPEIKKINDIMLENKAVFSKMTGTGSTVFGFFKELDSIEKVINALASKYFFYVEKYS